jgi:pyruvate, water dikinase
VVIWFDAPSCVDVATAGGKGASLARMTALRMPVPPGFVVPALALATRGLDAELAHAIGEAYRSLGDEVPVAVRSSATAEDSRAASFAGQHETYLHVRGSERVLARVLECWASRRSERAVTYRRRTGAVDDVGMAVVVQRMVEPDVAGVMFTIDPLGHRRGEMVVEAVLGLGEALVAGRVTPDHYVLRRDGALQSARIADQPYAIVPDPDGGIRAQRLRPGRGGARKLDEEQLRRLARVGRELELHLGGPQDVEWAIRSGELYLLQSRPVTGYGQPNPT